MAQISHQKAQSWQEGQEMLVGEEMMSVTLDVVAKTLFGTEVHGEAEEIGNALHEGQEIFKKVANPLAELLIRLPVPSTLRMNKVVSRLDATIYRIIEEHRQDPNRYTDLLSMLLAAQDEETGEGMTNKQVRDEAMTLFTAGHETTALALMWCWFLLAKHPDVEANLHAELDEVLKGNPPAFEDIPKLTYTRQVFSEALRLYPPAWALTRETIEDVQIGDYKIRKGATIDISPYLLHRDSRFWANPDEFNPERFSSTNKKEIGKFTYLPFSVGIRGCIGEQFAWMEGIVLLATLAQHWKLSLLSTANPVVRPIITTRPVKPIRMQAVRRKVE